MWRSHYSRTLLIFKEGNKAKIERIEIITDLFVFDMTIFSLKQNCGVKTYIFDKMWCYFNTKAAFGKYKNSQGLADVSQPVILSEVISIKPHFKGLKMSKNLLLFLSIILITPQVFSKDITDEDNFKHDNVWYSQSNTYQTFEEEGFIAKSASKKSKDAHITIQYGQNLYLNIFLQHRDVDNDIYEQIEYEKKKDNIFLKIGDAFEISGLAEVFKVSDDNVISIEDEDGNVVKPKEVLIKDELRCIGIYNLCCIDDIEIKTKGRMIRGVEAIACIVPELFVESFEQEDIDIFFHKLMNEKLSDAIIFLEDLGLDLKPLLLEQLAGSK